MTEENKNEISNEKRDEQDNRRGGDGEISEDFDRWSDKRYMDEFEKVFSGGDERDGAGLIDTAEESTGKDGDNESEYEGYEEW